MLRICKECGKPKSISSFFKSAKGQNEFIPICKACLMKPVLNNPIKPIEPPAPKPPKPPKPKKKKEYSMKANKNLRLANLEYVMEYYRNNQYCADEDSINEWFVKYNRINKECIDKWKETLFEDKSRNRPPRRRFSRSVSKFNTPSAYTRDARKSNPWRSAVLYKHKNTCRCCGSKEKLEAHHLYSYIDNIEMRWQVENGIILCQKCHKEFHGFYGNGYNNLDQFNEFMERKGKNIKIKVMQLNFLS